MHFRLSALPFLLGAFCCCSAQNLDLLSGSIVVDPGTHVRFVGPITWSLASGTSVENNGVIDLGVDARLIEAPGAPIRGTGEEHAGSTPPGPFVNLEPGGLGLLMSTEVDLDGVNLIRRHTPIVLPEGDESVARWFEVDAPAVAGSNMAFTMRYDASELNALQANGLSLYRTEDLNGPWEELTSTSDPFTVTATSNAPWHLIAAFADDAVTGMPEDHSIPGFRVWPTAAEDRIHIAPLDGRSIRTLEILDGLGRTVRSEQYAGTTSWCTIDLLTLRPGAYLLRVNGVQIVKFVKA